MGDEAREVISGYKGERKNHSAVQLRCQDVILLKKQIPIRKVAQSDLYVAKICFGDCA